MKNITKILIAEHDPNDLELLHHELSKGGLQYIAQVVENEAGYINALETFIPDIILAAYAFPSFNGRRAFKIKEQICPDTPFILVSGTIGEENAIELIKSGVTDFVLKDSIVTLNTKLARALKDAKARKQKNKTEKELVQSETHLAEAQKLAKMGSWDYDFNSGSIVCSQELYNVFGVDKQTFIFTHGSYMDLIDEADRELVRQISQDTEKTGKPYTLEYRITTPRAEKRIISELGYGHQDKHGKITRLIGTARDITAGKRSETALKKAYDEKNAVLESIEDGFFTVDKNSLVTYWNKKAETLLDKKRADVIGRNLHEIFGGRDSNIFYDNYKKAARNKTTVRFEAFSTQTDKWFAVSAFASDNGLSVYFKDVTEQKNDEEKIKESELRYRSIIEQATDAICIADAAMKIIDINHYGCQMLGYSKAEFMQLTINDLFLAEDLITNPFKIEELQSGKVIRNERRFKSKNGTLIDVDMSGRILADGRFIVFGHDIAERKQADDKIKESELRYRSLNEQATDAICIADASMKFIDINPYACELFGYSKNEALQLSFTDVLFTEDLIDNPLKIPELKLGKTIRNERRLKRKDGTAVDMEVSTRIMEDGTLIMFGHDITERKKAEEKLRKANRLYTFISQVNQNIVQIKDEAELFRNACQIAFEFGKFKIAWTGILNKETEKITLVDQNGIADEDILLFTDAPYQKNGPQDHVLRTGTYYLCNDIEHDLQLKSWKPFAAKYGICSLIVLPVKKSGHIIGTFNLYATELNFFDKEEITLLTEVSEDISYALDILENAKKQKETEALILENEKRFRVLIEKSVDMKTLSTAEGKLVYGSASITKFLGYSPDELPGKFAYEMVHPDDAMTAKSIQELFAIPGKSFQMQQRMLHKNGTWVWCEGTITNMLHEPGINALVSNFRDISEKKLAEQLREFESSNLNALINNTTDLMWSVDKNCRLITFNQPFFDIIRFVTGKEFAKGDDVFSVILSPAQNDRFKISYERAFAGESFTDIEHIPAPVDSWSEISYYPIRNGAEIIGTACHSRDITERKKAEVNLAQSEKQFRQIVETAQEGIWLIDENKQTTFVNKRICEMLGYTAAEMLGKDLFYFMNDEGKQIAVASLDIQKKSGADNLDFMFLTKTGTTVWTYLATSSVLDEDGIYIGGLAMVTDITERRKIDESNKFKAELLNTVGQAVIATNMSGIVNFWNKAAENNYGWTSDEAIGKNIIDLTPSQQTKKQAEEIMKKLSLEQTWSGEFMVKRKDESDFPAYVTNAPIYDKQHQLAGIIGVSSDITERKQVELNLKESNERYKESEILLNKLNANLQVQAKELAISNADLEQFAYVASHDLQEPLRMVTSFLSQLQKKYGGVIDDKGKQYIEFAVDGAKRMRQIILDLLEFSRVGRTEDNQENIDLNELVDEMRILFRKQIQEKKAVIISTQLPHVHGYRSPLRQVFQNLISNALKYAGKDAVKINITCTDLNDYWQFAVRDNSIGIDQEYFDKIFIIFQRLHNKDEFSGTGMGLAITKKIIENQGGKIWVESEEGKGSTFYFTLLKTILL